MILFKVPVMVEQIVLWAHEGLIQAQILHTAGNLTQLLLGIVLGQGGVS